MQLHDALEAPAAATKLVSEVSRALLEAMTKGLIVGRFTTIVFISYRT